MLRFLLPGFDPFGLGFGPRFHYAPDAGGGAGGAAPKKIEITEDELQARITGAVKEAVDRAEDKHRQEVEAEQKRLGDEQARKQGEFQKLYDSETAAHKETSTKLEAADLKLRRKDASLMLRDYLYDKHRDYASSAKWIEPHIEVDMKISDDDLRRHVQKAADQYVKDNPRGSRAGAPEQVLRTTVQGQQGNDQQQQQQRGKKELPKPFYMNRR